MCVGNKSSKNVNNSMKFTNVNLYALLFLPLCSWLWPNYKMIQWHRLFHNPIPRSSTQIHPMYSKFVLIINHSMVNLKIFILCEKFNCFIHCVPFNHATFWPFHVVGISFEWLYLFFPWKYIMEISFLKDKVWLLLLPSIHSLFLNQCFYTDSSRRLSNINNSMKACTQSLVKFDA